MTLAKKWLAKLPGGDEFVKTLEGMKSDEVKKRLVECEKTIHSTEKDLEADNKITTMKEDLKILSSAYKEVLMEQKAVIKACLSVLDDRGEL